MPDLAWMAWTWQTGLFFVGIASLLLIMTLLGGMYSFFGPAIGAAALFILERLTNEYTEYWPTVLGGILLVILLFLPEGLAGLAKKLRSVLAGSR